jgi:hypothetical protein
MLEIDGVAREPAAETQIVFNTCMCPSLKKKRPVYHRCLNGKLCEMMRN